jgi:hypothetical protein
MVGLLAALLLSGCTRRAQPYSFRAPLVAGVRAERLPPRLPARAAPVAPIAPPRLPPVPVRSAEPAAVARIAVAPARGPADRLRDLVGMRDRTGTDLELALLALEAAGWAIPPALRGLDDGAALVARARERSAFDAADVPAPGDLVVFDEVVAGRPASLVGVVAAVDDRGVVEFVYLARGVVRRGFAHPGRAAEQRDADGRILNTLVRHLDGAAPRGARFLAGELMSGYVRLQRLSPPP